MGVVNRPERVERSAVYKVWMSDLLFEQLGAGYVDWGKPDADGFYTPMVHTPAWTSWKPTEEPHPNPQSEDA